MVASNDPDEMEKAIKYNNLIGNCIVLQNIIDYTHVIYQLKKEGISFTREDLSRISPYMTGHIRRFGDIIIDLDQRLENVDMIKNIRLF